MLFNFKKPKSIYARLFIVMCAAAIPMFLGLCFYIYQQRSDLIDLNKDNAQAYVDLAARDAVGIFKGTREVLNTISLTPVVQQGDWALCQKYLANLLKTQPLYSEIGILNPQGALLCSASRNSHPIASGLAEDAYFQRALDDLGLTIGTFNADQAQAVSNLAVALTARDKDNQPNLVFYAALNSTRLTRLRPTIQHAPGTSLLILDKAGIVLSAFPASTYAPGQQLKDKSILTLLAESARSVSMIRKNDGIEWFVSHTKTGPPEDPSALTVVYQYPSESLLRTINNGVWIGGAITALLVLLALILGWFGTQAIVGNNIRHLTTATKSLRQRDFTTRIGNKVTGLEFTEIAAQLDAMTEELSTREHQWEKTAQRQKGQNKILRLVARNHPLEETLEALLSFVETQIDDTKASIVLLSRDGARIASCIAINLPKSFKDTLIEMPIGPLAGTCGTAMYKNHKVISEDIATDPKWENYRHLALKIGLRACWSCPILSHNGHPIGAFALYSPCPRSPKPEELRLGEMAAELAAVAIEHQRQNEALEHQSKHDALTGLLNRSVLSSRIAQAIKNAKEKSGRFYVLILDLDRFKEINDALGHPVGDILLQQVGVRLQTLLEEQGTVFRSGGDEFSILINEPEPSFSIHLTMENVLRHIKQPFVLNSIEVQTSASIGVVQYPRDGSQTNVLLRRAETAMYQAKVEGVGYAFYDWKRDQQTPNQLLLMSHLRQAVNEHEFVLHYQPKISLKNANTISFEALIRWANPIRGLLQPADFIPIIELSDLIHPLSLWVMNTAIAQCKAWREQGHDVKIAVNVSARNLLDTSLPGKIHDILTLHGLQPQWLELEITESSIMADPTRSLDVLTKIHDIGVTLSIDDFGTGYSSLAYLQKLPVDNLKIDRSFISEMGRQEETLSIVSAIIALAHNLKLTVTAEGIEDHSLLAKLTEMGCDYAQGFYVGKPMPHENAGIWLKQGFQADKTTAHDRTAT